jgi:hypothetical protein
LPDLRRCLHDVRAKWLADPSVKGDVTSLGLRILARHVLSIIVLPDHVFLPLQVWASASLDGALDNLLVDHVELVLVGDTSSLIILVDSFDLRWSNSLVVLLELFQYLSFRDYHGPVIRLIQHGSPFTLGVDHLVPVSIIARLDFSDRLDGSLGRS